MKHFHKFTILLLALFTSTTLFATDQVVINNSDSGAGSLRQAIVDAVDGDEITFTLASGTETITILSELAIAESLTINGSNSAGSGVEVTVQVTAPGTSTFRVFNIDASEKTVAISNMTIKGGDVSSFEGISMFGGSILINTGTLNLDNVIVSESKAHGGGGILINEDAICSIEGCTISHCTATDVSGSGGGGILCVETISSINNTSISYNSTSTTGEGYGGGIYLYYGGTLTSLTNSTINNNTAVMGGGLLSGSATIGSIINCTVSNNIASNMMGGIYLNASTLNNMNFCTVSNNSATNYPDYDIGLLAYNSTVTIQNSILANNNNFDYYFVSEDGRAGSLTDNGNNIVGISNVAANATGGFNHATSILYNTKHDDPSTTETS